MRPTLAAKGQVEGVLLRELEHGDVVILNAVYHLAQHRARIFQHPRILRRVVVAQHRTCGTKWYLLVGLLVDPVLMGRVAQLHNQSDPPSDACTQRGDDGCCRVDAPYPPQKFCNAVMSSATPDLQPESTTHSSSALFRRGEVGLDLSMLSACLRRQAEVAPAVG